jgi:hypothetical protein
VDRPLQDGEFPGTTTREARRFFVSTNRKGFLVMDILDILLKSLSFLKTLAALTATKVDDEIVELLQAIADSPALVDWLKGLIESTSDNEGVLSLIGEPSAEVTEALRERKIDWARLIEKLPALIALLKAFSGK